MYAPYAIVTSPEPAIMIVTSVAPETLTLASLQDELNGYELPTPAVVDRLNNLRDSYRAAQREIAVGRRQPADFPLWDATPGRDGKPLGFYSIYSRVKRCADRLGLVSYKFGYRKPASAAHE